MRTALTGTNLLIRFLLELCALAAIAFGGYQVGGPVPVRIVVAVALPVAAALLWGRYAAPTSTANSPVGWLLTQVLVFGGAVAALALTGHGVPAAVLGVVMVLNTAVLWALGEWHPSRSGQIRRASERLGRR